MNARHGTAAGTKAMIGLLQLGRRFGQDALRAAIETALTLGCTDSAAVEHLLTAQQLTRPTLTLLEPVAALAAFERPAPVVTEYDQLLQAVAGGPA